MRDRSVALKIGEASLKFGEGPSPKPLGSWRKGAGQLIPELSNEMDLERLTERPLLLFGKM